MKKKKGLTTFAGADAPYLPVPIQRRPRDVLGAVEADDVRARGVDDREVRVEGGREGEGARARVVAAEDAHEAVGHLVHRVAQAEGVRPHRMSGGAVLQAQHNLRRGRARLSRGCR